MELVCTLEQQNLFILLSMNELPMVDLIEG